MDIAQNAVEAYKQSISTAEVYTADGNMYKGLPGTDGRKHSKRFFMKNIDFLERRFL